MNKYAEGGMVCVDGCPEKMYGDDITKTCEACRVECATCYDKATCASFTVIMKKLV